MSKKESSLVTNVWVQRDLGLDLSENLTAVTPTDIEYVCDNVYPFLQVVNGDAVFAEETTVNFIPTTNGWVIHDYSEAISVAAPHEAKRSNEMAAQIVVVSEIANLIAKKGWVVVELITGTPMMQFLLWLETKRYGLTLNGYTPSEIDTQRYDLIIKRTKASGLPWAKQVFAPAKSLDNKASGAGAT